VNRIQLLLSLSVAFLFAPLSPAHAAKGDVIDINKVHNSVHISLGQKIAVVFDQRGDQLVNPRRVQSAQKGPFVTLEFSADDKTKGLLMLLVKSSYPRIARYRAAFRLRGRRDFLETNMLPLNPNIPVLEGWMDPFDEIVLFDFHLTNEKAPKSA
jgi:hypothetical protein